MNHSGTIPVHTLLEHHEFVRRLARSLVRDEATADDLAQDAWLTALENPPREATSLRGWFASVLKSRVANRRRADERRVGREAATARAAEDDSDAQRVERLETGQSVVAAVLALEDPYRSVILLAYYDGLAPAEIARRRGVPDGTVRSQLSRGHALLRESLDRKFGERRTWLALFIPLAAPELQPAAAVGGAKLVLAATALVALGTAPLLWRAWQGGSKVTLGGAAPTALQSDVEFLAALALPSGVQLREELHLPSAATAGPQTAAPASIAAAANALDVSRLSVDELLVLAEHTQNLLRERVLLNADAWPDALRSLSVRSDSGICWLLPRDRFPFEAYNPLGVRGGGAYWSFARRTHEQEQLSDLSLDGGNFTTGFYGGAITVLTPLECASLLEVPTRADGAPETWSEASRERWTALWRALEPESNSSYPEFRAGLSRTGLVASVPAELGRVYAIRSAHVADSADTLAAFQVVDSHEGALRVVWRVLAAFETPAEPQRFPGAPPTLTSAPPPRALAELDVRGLIATFGELQRVGQQALFAIEPSIQRRYAEFAERPDSGLVRILPRERFVRLVAKREGGAYWSFETLDHDYDAEPDLGLEQGSLRSGFYGETGGLLLDCGEVAVAEVVAWGREAPIDWREDRRAAYAFLWDVRPVPRPDAPGSRGLSSADRDRAADIGLTSEAKALVGHSYVVRSNLSEEHDLIAAFEIVEHSETGITIVWRKLAEFSDE